MIPRAHAWDEYRNETGEFEGVGTYYNPSFGSFTKYVLGVEGKKAQDLADSGFFGLYVGCDTGEKVVRLQYARFDPKSKDYWTARPLAPIQRTQVKFGNQKPISWKVSSPEWFDESRTAYSRIFFSNPTLFVKKLSLSGSVSLPINAERLDYTAKFITKGFKAYNSSFKEAGCD